MSLNLEVLSRAADQARGLCIDAVHASQSGHLGLPLGCAEMGAVLYGYALHHNPDKPRWINRDYFVLSAGHGSMFLYAWLHLSGYDLPMSEIERFRQLHSKTPGHPEFFETPGVECTTGPLGQGVANAVGRAPARGTPFVLPHAARKLLPGKSCDRRAVARRACNHLHESRVKYPVGAGYTIFICRGTRMDPIN